MTLWQKTRREALGLLGAAAGMGCLPLGASDGDAHHRHVTAAVRNKLKNAQPRLRLLIPHGCGANLAPVVARFTNDTGVDIQITETGVDEINTKIALDWLSQSMEYDIALPATSGLPDLIAAGALHPIDEFVARYEPPGFRDGLLFETGDTFDGKRYGFQTDGDTYMIFYNDDFLSDTVEQDAYANRFGTPLGVPSTWAELDRQMEWFHRPDNGMYGGTLFRGNGYVGWEWWVRFHAKGRWPLDKDLTPLIDGDAGVEALEELMRASEFLCEESGYFGLFENWERYGRGDAYANIGWGGSQKYFNRLESKIRGRLRFGPTPGGMVDNALLPTSYFNWGWTYAVTSKALDPELAYLFTLFAAGPEISTASVAQQDGFFNPFRVEHYSDPAIGSIYSRPFLKVHLESMKSAIPDLYLARQSQYLGALNAWIQRAIDGQAKPRDALKLAARQWELISTGAGREKQIERWAALRQKYPADVRERLRFDK